MDKLKADKLLLTLTSAYVWVASSDEGVTNAEIRRFEHCLTESPFATHFNMSQARNYFKDMVEAFRSDFDKSISLTSERIKAFKTESFAAEEIIRFSRAALVGDGKLNESEEIVLSEIGKILNSKI